MSFGRSVLAVLAAVALPAAAAPQHYSVAFTSTSSLPSNVDKIIADAGGTIVERLPEIGGVGVVSSNPNFLTNLAKESTVKAADVATETSLDPTWNRADTGITSADDNGGTYS